MGDGNNKPIEKKGQSSSSTCCCCCCTVAGWIRVITWTKISLYLLMAVAIILILSTSGSMWHSWMPKKLADALLKWTMLALWFLFTIPLPLILLVEVKLVEFFPRLQLADKEGGRQVFIVFGFILFLFFLSIIMSIVLLTGVSQKSRRKLNAWMIYAVVCMTLTVFEAAAGIILQNLGLGLYEPPRLIVRVMVSMTFQAFEVGTVLMFRTRYVDEKEEDGSSTLTVAVTTAPAPAPAPAPSPNIQQKSVEPSLPAVPAPVEAEEKAKAEETAAAAIIIEVKCPSE